MTSDYPDDDMRSSEPLNLPDPSRQAARGDRPDTPTGQPLPPLRIDASLDPDPWHGDEEVEIDLPATSVPVIATGSGTATGGDRPPESPASDLDPDAEGSSGSEGNPGSDPTTPATLAAPAEGIGEGAIVGNPITGNPIAGNPITGNPITGNPIAGNPIAGNPITGNPMPGNQTDGNPITGNPIAESSSAESSSAENPIAESSSVESLIAESPIAESETDAIAHDTSATVPPPGAAVEAAHAVPPAENEPASPSSDVPAVATSQSTSPPEFQSASPPESAQPPGAPADPSLAPPLEIDPSDTRPEAIAARIQALLQQEQDLKTHILALQTERAQLLESQLVQAQGTIGRMIQDGMAEMEQRRQALQVDLEQLERRRDRIRKEMRTTFAGSSQSLAVRVQGFKDYLVGSLQELVTAAEELQLVREAPAPAPTPAPEEPKPTRAPQPQFAAGQFTDEARTIQKLIDRYRNNPDYYGPPWRLRRTFEPIHAERVSSWFFDQGGRGALRTLGSRLQNILVVSATASVLRALYGDRLRLLVAIDSPERLGEWRRGLQDCLGISRADFGGPNPGVMLFESSEPLVQKAERLVRQGNLPFIAIDEAEGKVSLSLLQFPLWLAFAPDPRISNTYDSFF